jgi:hypothetical protein
MRLDPLSPKHLHGARAAVAAVACTALLAACGSTAQVSSTSAPLGSDGLGGASTGLGTGTTGQVGGTTTTGGQLGGTAGAAGAGSTGYLAPATTGGTTGVGQPSPPTALQPARGPLKLGFINTTFANADQYGFSGTGHSTQQIYSALVSALNARGGLAGRQITPVYASIDFGSTNYNSDFQAMCSTFTEDDKVVAVPTYTIFWSDAFEDCLTKAGVTHISGYLVGDNHSQHSYPYLFGTATPTLNRAYVTQLSAAMATGRLTKANKVGVIRSECPYDKRAWEESAEPFIKQHGLNEAVTQMISCPSGAQGIGTIVAEIQNAVLRFQQNGVDTVIPVGGANQYFAKQADTQRYYPQYLITSLGDAADLESSGQGVPASQLKNFHGFGWFPTNDIAPSHQPTAPAAQQSVRRRCLDLLRSRGITMSEYVEIKVAYTTCDALFLYERALLATNGHTEPRLVRDAVLRLGTSFTSLSTLNGRTRFASGQRDAPAAWRAFNWNASCACFRYDGPERAMPLGTS